jgi:hypothetical protein
MDYESIPSDSVSSVSRTVIAVDKKKAAIGAIVAGVVIGVILIALVAVLVHYSIISSDEVAQINDKMATGTSSTVNSAAETISAKLGAWRDRLAGKKEAAKAKHASSSASSSGASSGTSSGTSASVSGETSAYALERERPRKQQSRASVYAQASANPMQRVNPMALSAGRAQEAPRGIPSDRDLTDMGMDVYQQVSSQMNDAPSRALPRQPESGLVVDKQRFFQNEGCDFDSAQADGGGEDQSMQVFKSVVAATGGALTDAEALTGAANSEDQLTAWGDYRPSMKKLQQIVLQGSQVAGGLRQQSSDTWGGSRVGKGMDGPDPSRSFHLIQSQLQNQQLGRQNGFVADLVSGSFGKNPGFLPTNLPGFL